MAVSFVMGGSVTIDGSFDGDPRRVCRGDEDGDRCLPMACPSWAVCPLCRHEPPPEPLDPLKRDSGI